MESKAETRKKIINFLIKLSKDDKDSQTKHITSSLVSSDNWKNSEVVGLYMPTTIEFDLVALYKIAEEEGKKILIPKCLPNRKMIFAPYVTNELKKSKFGIMEPTNLTEVTPDYILVPGLAWNSDGYRIGFGGGYYDRYLKKF